MGNNRISAPPPPPQDKQIKMKNEFDLWKNAIGPALKYGLATIRIDEANGREVHQFASKRTRGIIYPKRTNETSEYGSRNANLENRTKYCLPTTRSQIQKGNLRHISTAGHAIECKSQQ